MEKIFKTTNAGQTKKLGELLGKDLRGGEIICLTGDLGTGKTTFAQGFLEELGATGPYTSPTFLIMKQYESERQSSKIRNIFHIDAYRVIVEDILNLGWEEMAGDKNNVIIIEWADRIKKIIPDSAVWINFEWISKNKRKIIFNTK